MNIELSHIIIPLSQKQKKLNMKECKSSTNKTTPSPLIGDLLEKTTKISQLLLLSISTIIIDPIGVEGFPIQMSSYISLIQVEI
jgi:hypothetical protein